MCERKKKNNPRAGDAPALSMVGEGNSDSPGRED